MFPPSLQPCLQGTRRSVAFSPGPRSQPHKTLFGICHEEARAAAAAAGAGCQFPPATQVYCRLASLPRSRGLQPGCTWLEAQSGAVSPRGGKIMMVLVFMGHNITSVGGSGEAVAFRGYGRL